jgi:hypothetical protein
MTPVRPQPEDLDTPELIAEAADVSLLARNINVLASVHSVQSTLGKRWTLSGRKPDKRAMWRWFGSQLKTTFLSINDCFRPILVVDDRLIPPGTVFSRVAYSHLYMVLLQLTTETARILIETQVGFDAQDGHRALVALANFYAPMNDGRVDELTLKIMNVHIGAREDPQPLMIKLRAYREELFAASAAVKLMKLVSLQISTTPWGTSTAWH